MGAFAENVPCQMLDINLFNLFLDQYELQAYFEDKVESLINEIVDTGLGRDNKLK